MTNPPWSCPGTHTWRRGPWEFTVEVTADAVELIIPTLPYRVHDNVVAEPEQERWVMDRLVGPGVTEVWVGQWKITSAAAREAVARVMNTEAELVRWRCTTRSPLVAVQLLEWLRVLDGRAAVTCVLRDPTGLDDPLDALALDPDALTPGDDVCVAFERRPAQGQAPQMDWFEAFQTQIRAAAMAGAARLDLDRAAMPALQALLRAQLGTRFHSLEIAWCPSHEQG